MSDIKTCPMCGTLTTRHLCYLCTNPEGRRDQVRVSREKDFADEKAKAIIDSIAKGVSKEIQAWEMEAVIYGQSFLRLTSDGEIRHVPLEEMLLDRTELDMLSALFKARKLSVSPGGMNE